MIKNFGFKFDNTYVDLPEIMVTKLPPVAVKKPKLVVLNQTLADSLGLDFSMKKVENGFYSTSDIEEVEKDIFSDLEIRLKLRA